MVSSENQQQNPNPAPPFPSAGDHEMRDYYAAQDASRPPSQQEPYLTPYLGLRARLSQTWINRWTILLLLVLVRTLFALASVNDDLGQARKEALSACTSVENVGSAMASMPHYLAGGVNALSAQGIEKAINGLIDMLLMTITGVEEIVVFIINFLTQTYVCLITFAVGGSLHAAISVAEDVGGFLNSTVKGVSKDLGTATADFQTAMQSFINDIDKLGSLLTGNDIKPPKIDLSKEIDKLNSLQLPLDYDSDLKKLNADIPTFAQVKNFTNTVIEFPFEKLKSLLREALPTYTLDQSIFPVPAKKQLTFCSDNNGINDFFDDLVKIAHTAKIVFLVVLIILAVLAMIPMAWREIRRWHFMKERARLVQSDAFDPMDAVYIASRPYTSTAGLKIADKFKSRRRQTLIRWSVAYATTVPALFVLSLALAGLLASGCQLAILKIIEKEVPKLENQVIGFADKVINELDDASQQWAVGTNDIITHTNNKINNDVFGWVNISTTAINDTLNTFVNETEKVLNETFGGTVLRAPIQDVLNCLIFYKIQGIEDGLTWVSDHAHIDFPLLPNNTFSLGAIQKVSGSEDNILATGPDGGAADAITAAMFHVTNVLEKAIRQEAIISACLLIIYLIIVLIGIIRAAFLMFKGGDSGTYTAPTLFGGGSRGLPEEKHEMHDFFPTNLPRVPTYEQATRSAEPGDNAGNKYNGQSYTLTPNPMPSLQVHSATSPILNTGFSPNVEKFGAVNGQNVDAAIRRPTHVRTSSYGNYEVTSPNTATVPPSNPFTDTRYLHPSNPSDRNPFADPGR